MLSAIILTSMLLISLFLTWNFLNDFAVDVFVGIDVAYDNVEEIKMLVDEVGSYINTIIIGSTGITFNMTKLDHVCQYVYDKGLYFMIFAHPINDPEELLVEDDELKKIWLMRKALSDLDSVEAMQLLISRLNKSKNNKEFLENMGKP